MSRKNDLVYYENNWPFDSFLVFGGGRHKMPLWLAMTTWGILAVLVVTVTTVYGAVQPVTAGYSAWAPLVWGSGIVVIGPFTVWALFWIGVGIRGFVNAWRKFLRGERS